MLLYYLSMWLMSFRSICSNIFRHVIVYVSSLYWSILKWIFGIFGISYFASIFSFFISFCFQLDLPLSTVFYKWILGQEQCLTSADLSSVDPMLAKSYYQLEEVLRQKKRIESDRSHVSAGVCLILETNNNNFRCNYHWQELLTIWRKIVTVWH